MRKPRAVIYDDEVTILDLLSTFLSKRNYEVLSFSEPVVCPVYEKVADDCTELLPCADIIITDFRMPKMNGLELLRHQSKRGCKVDTRNKAVISGVMDDEIGKQAGGLGCAFFDKPLVLSRLSEWLISCEQRFDLSKPLCLVEKRKQARRPYHEVVEYSLDGVHRKISRSLSLNRSDSGFCLYLFDAHREGQNLTIEGPPPVGPRRATIRWTRSLQDMFWIAGLMFL